MKEREQLGRRCAWCGDLLRGRSDAVTCSKRCRQARHRFRVSPAAAATASPIRVAYADPPYPGCAKRYYGRDEVDHRALVDKLVADFPDGWALSTSSDALRSVLLLCPDDVRVGTWVRGARSRGRSHRARDAWEPVIFRGGRLLDLEPRDDLSNALVWCGRQHSHPHALVGMKPAAFCEWLFRNLGLLRGDELVDLFPGSGAVTRAWDDYVSVAARGATPSRLKEAQRRLSVAPSLTRHVADGRPRNASQAAGDDTSRTADHGQAPSPDVSPVDERRLLNACVSDEADR